MGKCAPRAFSDVLARVIILIIFIIAQALYCSIILSQLGQADGNGRNSFYVILPLWVIFSLLWVWAYISGLWMDAGSVKSELEALGYLKGGIMLPLPPQLSDLPVCEKCKLPKPERTHHCSTCNLCYFRFDHHCPVVGNCVALKNMKAFMLFMLYTGLLTTLFAAGCICSIIFKHLISPIILGIVAAFVFFLGLSALFFGISFCPMIFTNKTTLERIAGIANDQYNVGEQANFKQVFGNNCIVWFLPIRPSSSGFLWSGITEIPKASTFNSSTNASKNVIRQRNVRYAKPFKQQVEEENKSTSTNNISTQEPI